MIEVLLSRENSKKAKVELLVVPVIEGESAGLHQELDELMKGELRRVAEAESFEGKAGQSLMVTTLGAIPARRVALLGIGEAWPDTRGEWRTLGARSARAAEACKASTVAVSLPKDKESLPSAVEGLALGLRLASYRFDRYKTQQKEPSRRLEKASLLLPPRTNAALRDDISGTLGYAESLADGICMARDLVNEPPVSLTPTSFAERATAMAKEQGLRCKVLDRADMEKLGMEMFLAVSSGSAQPPKLTHLHYKPKGRRKKGAPVIALVGKGITFDSGGLSLKPSASMVNMHTDMAGAAAVFGAMRVIGELQPDIEVHGFLATAENMTGAAAYRLNDVLHALNGKTVEVMNTDAEGRLVLGDTLTYACQQGATEVIDLATLTGACLVALGEGTAALMSDHDELKQGLLEAAEFSGESVWELPLLKDLKESLKSKVADLKNIGDRWGGAITAGLFLQEFVEDGVAWAHLDIAGPSSTSKNKHHLLPGGTGFGVSTLVEYVLERAEP